ncbi:MAG TPA: hypothetical protein VNG29_01770 [Candidatus Paceibacterota bacterium]|nr:hypothetical protein [Candidatus Paceibacterota bacterium]
MSETSKKVIEEIHERQVTHRPKWHFLIKNISVWVSLAAAVFFGALSLSIEESVIEKGGGVRSLLGPGALRSLFQGVSLLWIVFTVLFIVLAFLNLRLTREGYRYGRWWVVLGIFLVVVTFGLLFYQEGIGDRAESTIEHNSFYHDNFLPIRSINSIDYPDGNGNP